MLGVSFCGLVLIVQAAVKAEVERDGALEPSSAAGSDCQGPQSEDGAGGDGEPGVCCRPDTHHLLTIEQTRAVGLIRSPATDGCPPSQFLPPPRHHLAPLGFVSPGLLLSGCPLLLCFLSGD